MKILIIEDDKLQFELIREILSKFSELEPLDVVRIATEADFRSRLNEIAENNPDVIMLDIMLRWADPNPNMQMPPKDVVDNGFERAGIRCGKLLSNNPKSRNIPIIVYSVLEAEDLDEDFIALPNVRLLIKDFEPNSMLDAIKSCAI
ncbi:MAG: hypothetical protein ACKVQJ_03605 [Pyrinomonadaceae bacterium]